MTAMIIDGRAVADKARATVRDKVASLNHRPGLAVVLVGDDPASTVYVRSKDRAAASVGIRSQTHVLPRETSEASLLMLLRQLNDDPDVDGILVQMPLPPQIRADAIIDSIDPAKDVDGLHPFNLGRLAAGRPGLVACTPLGVMKLLAATEVPLAGSRALVLGRSLLVGRPVALLLGQANATVTVAHSRTRNVADECRRSDIVVAAIGQPEMVRGDWIGDGATIIDVGINRLLDGRLIGDVDFAGCIDHVAAITPVPGGVGPMTIACLLENNLTAALNRRAA